MSPQYNILYPSNHSNPLTSTDMSLTKAAPRGISSALTDKAEEWGWEGKWALKTENDI